MATILIGSAVLVIIAVAAVIIIRDKKAGNGCGSCPSAGNCPHSGVKNCGCTSEK